PDRAVIDRVYGCSMEFFNSRQEDFSGQRRYRHSFEVLPLPSVYLFEFSGVHLHFEPMVGDRMAAVSGLVERPGGKVTEHRKFPEAAGFPHQISSVVTLDDRHQANLNRARTLAHFRNRVLLTGFEGNAVRLNWTYQTSRRLERTYFSAQLHDRLIDDPRLS